MHTYVQRFGTTEEDFVYFVLCVAALVIAIVIFVLIAIFCEPKEPKK